MQSFYGGPQGQSFIISAIFPNRVALNTDLQKSAYSPVKLNEFVMISYGMQNLDKIVHQTYLNNVNDTNSTYYEKNQALDEKNYKNQYNGTLWQKIYISDLETDKQNKIFWYKNSPYNIAAVEGYDATTSEETDTIAVINEYGNEIVFNEGDSKYCYICISNLSGQTPKLDVKNTIIADPAINPNVAIDNSNINFPELQFTLPRAVKFHWIDQIELNDDNKAILTHKDEKVLSNLGDGDIVIDISNGKLYTINSLAKTTDKNGNKINDVQGEEENWNISCEIINGCEIDLVPEFEATIDDSLNTYTQATDKDGNSLWLDEAQTKPLYELTNPQITVTPSDFSPDEPKYLIDFKMPKAYTPVDKHIIGYGKDSSGKTIYMGKDNESEAFNLTTAIDPTDSSLSKYKFTATIPAPVSIEKVAQMKLEEAPQNGKNHDSNLTKYYRLTLNNGEEKHFYVNDGKGILKATVTDEGETFALQLHYNDEKKTVNTVKVNKLPGPKGDSFQVLDYYDIIDYRSESDEISDFYYVQDQINYTYPNCIIGLNDYTEKPYASVLINLIKPGNRIEQNILLGSYLGWAVKSQESYKWQISTIVGGDFGGSNTELNWTELN